jgi:hypothetical protein
MDPLDATRGLAASTAIVAITVAIKESIGVSDGIILADELKGKSKKALLRGVAGLKAFDENFRQWFAIRPAVV